MAQPHTTTWWSPTTYFALACTAFALASAFSVYRSTLVVAPAHANQKSSRKVTNADADYDTISWHELPPRTVISRSIENISQCTAKLRRAHSGTSLRWMSLLTELSALTRALCHLEQRLSTRPSTLELNNAELACFHAAIAPVFETVNFLETGFQISDPTEIENATDLLRDITRGLGSCTELFHDLQPLPTPPLESDVALALGAPVSMVKLPGNEPPPEYSPPAESNAVLSSVLSHGEKQSATSWPPTSLPAVRETQDGDVLYNAVTENDIDLVVELLVNQNCSPNDTSRAMGRSPLHQASHLNHHRCITILLQHGADMTVEDSDGDTALHLAAWAGNVEALQTLLVYTDDVDCLSGRDGYSPLWCAISAQHIDACRLLLQHGARVSLRAASSAGLAPLHQAAATAQTALCQLLLERGAAVSARDDMSNTPLHYAAASDSPAIVHILLRRGAQIDAREAHGLRPLHWAAHKGHTAVVDVLLKHGAAVDVASDSDATALHMAAAKGHREVVQRLLDHGADATLLGEWDEVKGTPAQVARKKGHGRVARLIEECCGIRNN